MVGIVVGGGGCASWGGEQTPTLGLNLAQRLFLYGLHAKDGFYIFKWLKKVLKKIFLNT